MKRWIATTFSALAVRDFRYLWLGSFSSQIGMWLQMVALGWLAYDLTGSAAFLGLVAASRSAPSLLLTLPAGVLADRWDRRRIVLASQTVSAALAVALAWLVATGAIAPWHLLVSGLVLGGTHSFNMPARQSLAPQLAGPERTANAVALNAISFNTSRVLGPSLAGVLILIGELLGGSGIAICFAAQAALGVVGLLWTLAIRSPVLATTAQRGSVWANLVDGLRYARNSRAISGVLVIAAVSIFFGQMYAQFMPVFARDVLSVGASGLGVLMSAIGVGSLVGAFITAALSQYPRKGLPLMAASTLSGAALVLFASSQWYGLSLMALALVGLTQSMSMAMSQTLLNLIAPNDYRGRVLSLYQMVWVLEPLVLVPAGWLTDLSGVQTTILIAGSLVLGLNLLVGSRLTELRRFSESPPAATLRVPASPRPSDPGVERVPQTVG